MFFQVWLLCFSWWYMHWKMLAWYTSICVQHCGQSFFRVDNSPSNLCIQSFSVFWRHQPSRQWRTHVHSEDCQFGLCRPVFLWNGSKVDCFWTMEILHLCLDLPGFYHCLCKLKISAICNFQFCILDLMLKWI